MTNSDDLGDVFEAVKEERDALKAQVKQLQREVAEGFTVSVVDVTNDAATLAECGRLKAQVEELKEQARAADQSWARLTNDNASILVQVEELKEQGRVMREHIIACAIGFILAVVTIGFAMGALAWLTSGNPLDPHERMMQMRPGN